ncbi:MAG: type II/IV secretion system protein [Alphaproteobacteria bacterium]|nr:type II/IV secretion system protein [Alphaproteobacteria bacterium]
MILSDDETVTSISRPNAVGDDAPTVHHPDADGLGAEIANDAEALRAIELLMAEEDGTEVSAVPHAPEAVPTVETAEITDEGELPPLVADMLAEHLLTDQAVRKLVRTARATGKTFFRCVAEDRSLARRESLFAWAAKRAQASFMFEERVLLSLAQEEEWLRYGEAERAGALLLADDEDGTPRFATIDPFDIEIADWIERCSGRRHSPVVVPWEVFLNLVHHLVSRATEGDEAQSNWVINFSAEEERFLRENMDAVDVPSMVNYFLHRAYIQKASDIHIEPTEDRLLVRVRVDGILHEDVVLPKSAFAEVAARVKIISHMDVVEKRRPQDGRIGTVIQGVPIDVRVSTFPTVYGEKTVMRLLDKNALRPSPESLGLVPRDLRLLKDKIEAPYGLIMISGPTGSGKTTTLYSCLGAIDKTKKNVMTIEDPVEYRLRGVHQMQVNTKIGVTFASGLRTILRQDPDVVMVGECRDLETAEMAIQASLTGHVVFTTIHTNDAVGIVTRLLDMGIDRFLVASAITLGIAQRLVRKTCPHCQTHLPGTEILRRIRLAGVSDEKLAHLGVTVDEDLEYAVGNGCLHCRNTGYMGRTVVFEAFEMTNEARNMIMNPDFNADELRRNMTAQGMTTLLQHGLMLVDQGLTTHDEVIRVLGERL